MNKWELNELVKYLSANLNVYIEQSTDFGPVEKVTVKLELCGNVISESSCELPSQED